MRRTRKRERENDGEKREGEGERRKEKWRRSGNYDEYVIQALRYSKPARQRKKKKDKKRE